MVVAGMHGIASLLRVLPSRRAVGLAIDGTIGAGVVVYNHLVALPVALTGRPHHGTRILEHGHEIGDDDGLGKQVLGGAEEIGTLPFPSAFLGIVVLAMAGGNREVTAFQAAGNLVGARHVGDPRLALVVDAAPGAAPVRALAQAVGHKVVDQHVVGIDLDVVVAEVGWQNAAYAAVDVPYHLRGEFLFSKSFGSGNPHFVLRFVHAHAAQFGGHGKS